MEIAGWVHAALSRADDWRAELEKLRAALPTERRRPERLARTLELADATEHIEPDRSRALALYLAAWRDGERGARTHLLELARELRAYMTLAEIAHADHEDTKDPEALVAAGRALIDADLAERAAQTFIRAAEQHPSLADSIATSPRLIDVRVSIGLTKLANVDPEREIDACMGKARDAGDGGAPYFLQAARIARMTKLTRRAAILGLAAKSAPNDREIVRMFEDVLLDSGSADDFLVYHRHRLEATQGGADWVECVRDAACELVLRNVHPGLGLRMLRTSIEHAYANKLPGRMRRHIAAWELLVANAKETRSTIALAPLLADGLRADLPPLDALYIAKRGLEVAWKDAGDALAAQPYVAKLLDRSPGHPLAAAFLSEAFPDAPIDLVDIPEEKEPVMPTVTFRIPTIATARLPSVELKRDASPIPAPPAPPPDATMRSPRKVVPVDVVVELPTGAFFSAMLRDLSTSGAFVSSKRVLEVGIVVTLEIRLPGAKGLTQRNFRIDARIARKTELGYGLAFVNPPPELVAGITLLVGD
ncbi:MAG: PilZ domain-containing protein [Deltaproteobacteria bacterium]|nr:PilZ domain-containing protein [Deltaproteobacteria bacterium]